MERDFKGVRIPKEIRLADDINIMCKILLVEIDSLSNTDCGCYASNEYFSKFLWISEKQVSQYISLLKEKWYIQQVSFDWRVRVLKSSINIQVKAEYTKRCRQGTQKGEHINTYSNLKEINNTSIIYWAEAQNEQQPLNVLSPVGENPTTPLPPSSRKRQDIDELITEIKEVCNEYSIAYDKTKDRMFAKHILDWKEIGEFCDNIGQSRMNFAVNVLIASIKINYFKGACSGPMKIYQNYAEVYNQTAMKHNKQSSVVGFLPWLNIW